MLNQTPPPGFRAYRLGRSRLCSWLLARSCGVPGPGNRPPFFRVTFSGHHSTRPPFPSLTFGPGSQEHRSWWDLNHGRSASLHSLVQIPQRSRCCRSRICSRQQKWGWRDLNPRSTDISGHVAPRYSRGSSRRPVISRTLCISVWSSSRARGLWSQSPCLAWPQPLDRGFVGVTYSGYDWASGAHRRRPNPTPTTLGTRSPPQSSGLCARSENVSG
jgi:hypothetical protein